MIRRRNSLPFPRQARLLLVSVLLFALAGQPPDSSASGTATVEAAVLASRALPAASQIGKDVARIPLGAAKILRLPMGAMEVVLSPLPGIKIRKGLTDIGAGLIAPFELGIDVLCLPYRICEGLGKISPGEAAGLNALP